MSRDSEVNGLKAVVTFLILPFTCILYAFAMVKLWMWFFVPFGLPPIGKAHAYGISCFVQLITIRTDLPTKEASFGETIAMAIAKPLLAWGLGYLAHSLM